MTDKNGNKIFEGDIVKGYTVFGKVIEEVVTYSEDFTAFVVDYRPLGQIANLEKVGNIYDNPELLKEGKK